jgi:uncharacterized metal-binding protein
MAEEKATCCNGEVKTLVLACSGGSNVGQVSNSVMVELDKKGLGSGFCLIGLGADLSGFVESTRVARTVLIDGCTVACGKKVFAKHGIEPSHYFVVTDFGIEKKHAFDTLAEETERAMGQIVPKI